MTLLNTSHQFVCVCVCVCVSVCVCGCVTGCVCVKRTVYYVHCSYLMRDGARGLSACFSLSVCLSVRIFDICCSHGQCRTLYNPTPETITTDRRLVLFVDLDSIDADHLLRYSPLRSGICWGPPVCLCTIKIWTLC